MPQVDREGVSIHYESYGTGKPLVLLHPVTANRYFWIHQVFSLAQTHQVIVLDHRGHGLSSRPAAGYSVPAMTADLLAVLGHAKVERATLVGNSIGGMIAVQAALDAPARVSALVVVSSATGLAPLVPPEVRTAYQERFEATFAFVMKGAISARTRRERPEVQAFLSALSQVRENFVPAVLQACVADPQGVFDWDQSERLGELRVPSLILAGAEDQMVPIEATRALAEAIPGARFELVPEVGHYQPLERPVEFNERLAAFLATLG